MVDVDAEHLLKLSPVAIRIQSRHSRRTVPTQRSANAFAFGARNGVRMISTPSLRKTEARGEGASAQAESRFGPGSP